METETTTTTPQPRMFTTGVNPRTGGTAIRALVYEAMKQFPKENLRIKDVAALVPEYSHQVISDAVRDLIEKPETYPGVHRIALGVYQFDTTKPIQWMTFPSMGRKNKKRKKMADITPIQNTVAEVPTEQPAPESFPAPTTPAAPSPGVEFVSAQPVFDAVSGSFLPMTEARLLMDADGLYWHARRI